MKMMALTMARLEGSEFVKIDAGVVRSKERMNVYPAKLYWSEAAKVLVAVCPQSKTGGGDWCVSSGAVQFLLKMEDAGRAAQTYIVFEWPDKTNRPPFWTAREIHKRLTGARWRETELGASFVWMDEQGELTLSSRESTTVHASSELPF